MDEQVGYPKVQGRCPSCHSDSLFLGSGGFVTCSVLGCKAPGAATDALKSPESQFWCAQCGVSIHQYGTTLVKLGDGTFICGDCFYKERDRPKS